MKRRLFYCLSLIALSLITSSKGTIDLVQIEKKDETLIKRVNPQSNQFKSDCDLYGFTVGENWAPVWANNGTFYHKINIYMEKDKVNHTTTFDSVMLKNVYSSDNYAFIFRVGVSPVQCRNWGVLGIGSDSDDWYFRRLETKCQLRDNEMLADFQPKNNITEHTESISLNGGVSSSGVANAGISCGISYNVKELDITSECSISKNLYKVTYVDNKISKYTKYDSFYYGMFTFKCSGIPWVDMEFKVNYYGNSYYGANSSQGTVTYSHSF